MCIVVWCALVWLYAAPMDFVLVGRGYIDVAARVWLEVGWVWTYVLESNGVQRAFWREFFLKSLMWYG